MTEWDGRERRADHDDMHGRRNPDDRHCADHAVKWEYHDKDATEHRTLVCGKIAKLETEHNSEMTELKRDMKEKASVLDVEKKANQSDLKGMVKLVSVLIIICSAIVAGQAVWLKSDLSGVSASIQRLNIRITETVNDRVASDIQQLQKLSSIEGQLHTIDWRITQIENNNNNGRDGRDGKVGRDGRDAPK